MSLPKLDSTITVEQLNECGQKFLDAGYAYWEICNKINKLGGAVVWLRDDIQGMVIFTRGEYGNQLVSNIERQGPVFIFGAGDLNAFH